MSHLQVFFESFLVGTIDFSDEGPQFTYSDKWISARGSFPISVTMPKRHEPYGSETLVPWLANLLPESRQLEVLSHKLRIAQTNVFGILEQIGRDTSGALSFSERGQSRSEWRRIPDATALEKIIEELPAKPFLVSDEGVSMSLAGAQSKLAVVQDDDGGLHIPLNGSPSTHILKPNIPGLYGSVANEALCMILARRCGIPVPEVSAAKAGDREYLLVERYDRLRKGSGWRRIHQEDLCQALGRYPSDKYQKNPYGAPGPTARDLHGVVKKHGKAQASLLFMDQFIFNVLACNTDAHAKNYSLIIKGSGVSMAPIYDVMCSKIWGDITSKMANTIAKKDNGDYLELRHWQREFAKWRVSPRMAQKRVGELSSRVLRETDKAAEDVLSMLPDFEIVVRETTGYIKQRAQRILSGLDATQDQVRKIDDDIGKRMDSFSEGNHQSLKKT